MKDLNRIKVVLVEKKRTNKWLAEQLGKDPATISKWCTNTSQPDLATLLGWDGTYKGKECPQGTYVYRLSYRRSGNTKVYDFTGNIMLFR